MMCAWAWQLQHSTQWRGAVSSARRREEPCPWLPVQGECSFASSPCLRHWIWMRNAHAYALHGSGRAASSPVQSSKHAAARPHVLRVASISIDQPSARSNPSVRPPARPCRPESAGRRPITTRARAGCHLPCACRLPCPALPRLPRMRTAAQHSRRYVGRVGVAARPASPPALAYRPPGRCRRAVPQCRGSHVVRTCNRLCMHAWRQSSWWADGRTDCRRPAAGRALRSVPLLAVACGVLALLPSSTVGG